mgnify:CR=1 FL=1
MYHIYKAASKMTTHDLIRCPQKICLCLEYLDYSKKSSFVTYKNCYITAMLNEKYERKKNKK